MPKKVNMIKLSDDKRIYIYQRKVVYKEKIGDGFVTRFSGVSISDMLNSPVISDDVKEKIMRVIRDLS